MLTIQTTFPASSLDRGESLLACQITSPIQQKDRLFVMHFNFSLKTTQLIIEWGSYLASQ